MATKIDSFLKSLRNKTGSTSIKESRYGDVSTWISTGSLALNRILSGSIKKGIPSGRITILAGETSCSPGDRKVLVLTKKIDVKNGESK
jgi:RecA/RadA recombinase